MRAVDVGVWRLRLAGVLRGEGVEVGVSAEDSSEGISMLNSPLLLSNIHLVVRARPTHRARRLRVRTFAQAFSYLNR